MTISRGYLNNSYVFRASDLSNSQLGNTPQIISKPIEQVENIVNTTVDTFVPESQDEETKKSHKTAIKVGSTVLVLSAFVALLNPKFLTKFSNKLKMLSAKAGNKAQINGDLKGKIYAYGQNALDRTSRVLNFTNNINTIKDEGFKWLCNKVRFLKKPHEWITKGFDKISKRTVIKGYESANNKVNALNETLAKYAEKLSPAERKVFDEKIAEIKNVQEYFSQSKVEARLKNQEVMMSNLEKDSIDKMKSYFGGYKNPIYPSNAKHNFEHAKNNLGYWAEDVLKEKRAALGEEGNKVLSKITGDKTQKGSYNEIMDILSSHLKPEEKKALEDSIASVTQKIKKAGVSEYAEYFDNKRDLMLGSAPTDILSALVLLGWSGFKISSADTKEEKISKSLTGAFPIVAGMGSSLVLSALLFSGVKGKIASAILSGVLSLMGSGLNRAVNPKYHTKKEIVNA